MGIVGYAAQFYKNSHGRLELSSLWTREEYVDRHDGKTYFRSDGYDVEWSKEFGYIFHSSSSGLYPPEVDGIYYLSGYFKVKEKPCQLVSRYDKSPWRGKQTKSIRKRNKTRKLARLPKRFDMSGVDNLLQWLQENGIESDAVYCSTCNDWLPGSNDYDLCEHVWWCNKIGWYSTPDERCDCKDREECEE